MDLTYLLIAVVALIVSGGAIDSGLVNRKMTSVMIGVAGILFAIISIYMWIQDLPIPKPD
ncbi:MAG: hypothetical protein KAJ73_00640 [Zetaproteobacteria bacterium]|nr:hypothetical protein [Zetaproteobacteria bacterium]